MKLRLCLGIRNSEMELLDKFNSGIGLASEKWAVSAAPALLVLQLVLQLLPGD